MPLRLLARLGTGEGERANTSAGSRAWSDMAYDVYTYAYMYMYYVYAHIHIQVYIYIYICTYTYTYTCISYVSTELAYDWGPRADRGQRSGGTCAAAGARNRSAPAKRVLSPTGT